MKVTLREQISKQSFRTAFFLRDLKSIHYIILVALYVVAASVFSLHYGMRQFGGYDLSLLIDAQWRLSSGEAPGTDFVNTLPLTLLFALKSWGLFLPTSWRSLLWMNLAAFYLCATVVALYWLRSFADGQKCLALVFMSLPVLVTNHLWHSSLSQYVAIAYVVMTLHCLRDGHNSETTLANCAMALMSGLLVFSKQNLGLPLVALMIAASLPIAIVKPKEWRRVGRFITCNLVGIFAIGLFYVWVVPITPANMIATFTSVVARAHITREQAEAFYLPIPLKIAISVFVGLALSGVCTRKPLIPNREIPIAVSVVVSALPMFTDWDNKYNDAPLLLCSLILLADWSRPIARRAMIVVALIVLAGAAQNGIVRQRMHDVGVGAFWQRAPLTLVAGGYFDGLYAAPRFHEVRREIQTALGQTKGPVSVFCGPRLEFCYMDNGLASPSGLPLWWHPGSSYPLQLETAIIRQFEASQFTLLIFLHDDRTRMPPPILHYIESKYTRQDGFSDLDVYRLL
jgi:hypothetical protein